MDKKLSILLRRPLESDPVITGVTSDSRSVRRGFLFVALTGARTNGNAYIKEAIYHGATAIIAAANTPRPLLTPDEPGIDWNEITWIEDENPRRSLAIAASEFYHAQPETIFAVTGTNGKTSTVTFARQILQKMNLCAVSLGTLGIEGVNIPMTGGSMTTPDPVMLQAQLADLAAANITHVAIEASSHGLHQHRLDGVKIFAAAYTNLTHDHLDYHGTMENYRAAKLRLFSELLHKNGAAVINADTEEFEQIKKIAEARGFKIVSYGKHATDLILLDVKAENHGTRVQVNLWGQQIEWLLPFVGEFQIYNILCAVGLVLARCPKRLQEVIDIVPELQGVPGRLQLVKTTALNKPAVFVDYAHTPDALQNILTALRPHIDPTTNGKLICVFGCGGDRDKTKRPIMGRIASELSDHVIITDDNPRSEEADDIRNQIAVGAPIAEIIADRRNAILHAITIGGPHDIIVIAGKGHEQGQIIGYTVFPFDDVREAEAALLL